MSIEAMKQALEALEGWDNYGYWVWPETALEQCKRNTKESLSALRQAIEQAEQWDTSDMAHRSGGLSVEQSQHPLDIYERAYFAGKQDGIDETEAIKRIWVGLTDEEIAQVVGSPIDEVYLVDFRRVIEKLRSKNT